MVEQTESSELQSDVVVVGFGGAGAIAAIAAYDAGASVTIIEKREIGGGATRLSSGGICIPSDLSFANYLDDIWIGHTPRAVIERFVEEAMRIEEFCASIGISLSRWSGNSQEISTSYPTLGRPSWPMVRDGNMIRIHATAPDEQPFPPDVWAEMTNNERVHEIGRTYGVNLWEQLCDCVTQRDIPIHYGARASQLLTGDSGEITGVLAEVSGREIVFSADRAVVMTTGGFSSNQQMCDTYLSCDFVYAGTSDYADGDGHVMAQRAGARPWHMQAVCGQVGFKAAEIDQAFQPRAVGEAFVWVDKHGHRYTNETSEKVHNAWRNAALFDAENDLRHGSQWPRIPSYMVFDETMRRRAPICRDWRADYTWSLDNSAEIERGWIKRGETVVELAALLGMEPSVLQATVEKFNAACRDELDADLGRSADTMAPIETGPFYALPLRPMLISTQGGPEHDEESRVIGIGGDPIPRLYAAGELSSVNSWLYEAGTGHAECFAFGRIAGENAAREEGRQRRAAVE